MIRSNLSCGHTANEDCLGGLNLYKAHFVVWKESVSALFPFLYRHLSYLLPWLWTLSNVEFFFIARPVGLFYRSLCHWPTEGLCLRLRDIFLERLHVFTMIVLCLLCINGHNPKIIYAQTCIMSEIGLLVLPITLGNGEKVKIEGKRRPRKTPKSYSLDF